jgi:capsid protein
VAPLRLWRQVAGHIHMSGITGRRQMLFGEAKAQEPSVVGQEMEILAAEYLPQSVGRHPDFAAADHLSRLPQETVKIIVRAGKCFARAFQDASAVNSAKILHERLFLARPARGLIRVQGRRQFLRVDFNDLMSAALDGNAVVEGPEFHECSFCGRV